MNYLVNGKVTVSCWTMVEAESEEEALEIAEQRDLAEIHIDGTYEVEECWHIDTDGCPDNIEISEDK